MRIVVLVMSIATTVALADDAKQTRGPCAGHTFKECVKEGHRHDIGAKGTPKNPPRALAMYKAACDAKLPDACSFAADLATGPERRRLFKAGCTDDHPDGCTQYVHELDDSDTDADREEARKLRTRLCERKNGQACFALGDKSNDRREALRWYRRACDAGEDRGCNSTAKRLFEDKDPDATPAQATKALETMCERGSATACDFVAQRHLLGKGARASRDTSLGWWRKGCEVVESAELCRLYGRWYLFEGTTPAHRKLAVEFLEKACKGGSDRGCEDLATARRKQ